MFIFMLETIISNRWPGTVTIFSNISLQIKHYYSFFLVFWKLIENQWRCPNFSYYYFSIQFHIEKCLKYILVSYNYFFLYNFIVKVGKKGIFNLIFDIQKKINVGVYNNFSVFYSFVYIYRRRGNAIWPGTVAFCFWF